MPDVAFQRGMPTSVDAGRSILGAILLGNVPDGSPAPREEDSLAIPGGRDAWPPSSSSDALARAHSPPARSFQCKRQRKHTVDGWVVESADSVNMLF